MKPTARVLIEVAWLDHYHTTFFEHPDERLQTYSCVIAVVAFSYSFRTVASG